VKRIPQEVFEETPHRFWDVDPSLLDPVKHEDFILGRVLSKFVRGSVGSIGWGSRPGGGSSKR
jgi:hypothetical protein